MKAKKLPSGSYRVQTYDKETGKRHSITASTKKEAERQAALWILEHRTPAAKTFRIALDEYILDRSSVLSPGTIREYRRCQKKSFTSIDDLPLDDITDEVLQRFVNMASKDHSPKTVKNLYGIISAVFKTYCPTRRVSVTLPKIYRPNLNIPTEKDIEALLRHAAGHTIETPFLLAVFCGMRRGEIAALTSSDIVGNVIHVNKAFALDEDNTWVTKKPKSVSGERFVHCPDNIVKRILETGYLDHPLQPQGIESAFRRLQERAGIPKKYRFHDMRHYSASMRHALGIPDAYIMKELGWRNDLCLKNIYRHAITEEETKNNEIWDNYSAKIM